MSARIVVGVDGSEASLAALRWAVDQAALTGGDVEAIATWNVPLYYGWAITIPEGVDPGEDVQRALDGAVEAVRVEVPGVDITTSVVVGAPAAVLVEVSRQADLLVVGSRGHGAFAGMLIGSVSQHCATHAHCTVVVHRPRDHHKA